MRPLLFAIPIALVLGVVVHLAGAHWIQSLGSGLAVIQLTILWILLRAFSRRRRGTQIQLSSRKNAEK